METSAAWAAGTQETIIMIARHMARIFLTDFIILDWIFEGIVNWVASIVSQLFDAVSGLFLEALGTDMTAMEEYFPFVTKAYDVMQVTAWAILILITILPPDQVPREQFVRMGWIAPGSLTGCTRPPLASSGRFLGAIHELHSHFRIGASSR